MFEEFLIDIEKEISKEIESNNINGLMISILTSDKTVISKGFGYTSHLRDQRVDDKTLVGLQSSTKTFTAIAFLRAVELGLVDLDDPLIKYYSDFKVKSKFDSDVLKNITFRMLLSHTAGFSQSTTKGGCFNEEVCSFKERVESIKDIWLRFKPGTTKYYSNIGFDLVAYTLELITNQTYQDFLYSEIFNHLDIASFTLKSSEAVRNQNSFHGYLGSIESSYRLNDNGFGCGTGFISHTDLIKFLQFVLKKGKNQSGKVLISEKWFNQMYQGKTGDYGLGVFIEKFNGAEMYHHPGGGFGFISHMNWIPQYNVAVVIQTNEEYQGYSYTLTEKFFVNYLKSFNKLETKPVTPELSDEVLTPSSILYKKLEGFYSGINGSTRIFFKEDKLFIRVNGELHEMICRDGNLINEFIFNSKISKYMKLVINSDQIILEMFFNDWNKFLIYHQTELISRKLTPIKEEWKRFIGFYKTHYYISEINPFAIIEKDGNLVIDNTPQIDLLLHYKDEIFNKDNGEFVEFIDDHIRIDNAKATKINNPVDFFYDLYKKNPKHIHLRSYILEKAINSLKNLDRNEEAQKIEELSKKLYPEEK